MRKEVVSTAAASIFLIGSAVAEECRLDAEAPTMPDPKEATAEDRKATISEIKDYQSDLNAYRECLTATVENTELEAGVRQAALDAYNSTIETETKMVEEWQAFNQEYNESNT